MRRWTAQLRLAIRDMGRRKGAMAALGLQILLALVILQYAGIFYTPWSEFRREAKMLTKDLDCLWYLDNTDPWAEPAGDAQMEEEIFRRTKGKCYSFMDGDIALKDFVKSEALYSLEDGGGEGYQALMVTGYLPVYFSWRVSSGRMITDREFRKGRTDTGYIPVLLGSVYAGKCQAGQIIDGQYEVTGILSPGTFYLNPKWSGRVFWLDRSIVLPMTQETTMWDGAFFNNLYLVAGEETKNELELLMKRSFPTIQFRGIRRQLEFILKDNLEFMGLSLTFVALLSLLAFVSIAAMMAQFVSRRRKEIAVHLLFGASLPELYLRLETPFLLLFLLSGTAAGAILREKNELWWLQAVFGLVILLLPLGSVRRIREEDMYLTLRKENRFDQA